VLVLDVESSQFQPFDAAVTAAVADDPLAGVDRLQ
jgi:hypothetical protein